VRALTIHEKRLEIAEHESPTPGPYDVVVSVRAAGINAADLLQRQGFYPAPDGSPPDIPGMEVSGLVTQVGDRVVEPLMGRRVCAVVGGGAQAKECVVASEHLLFLPDHVSWEEAGGFPEIFSTAYDALVTQANLQSGERVLISGAAGGVGVAGVQIAHALGARVTAVTRTAEFHEQLRSLGANETITLDQVSTIDRVDVVLELLGAAHLDLAQKVLAPHARVVVIGVGQGGRFELDLLAMMRNRTTFTGSTLRARTREEKASVARLVGDSLIPRWEKGELTVPLARVFSFDEGEAAYDYFGQPGKFGKVVLRIAE
jgi:NADPH:quinone reductase-like Zn-dependent oxidoreductase